MDRVIKFLSANVGTFNCSLTSDVEGSIPSESEDFPKEAPRLTDRARRGVGKREKERMNEKQYSANERRAYHIGIGAALGAGKQRKQLKEMASSMNEKERKSFWNGVNDSLMNRAWKTGGRIKK